MVRYHSRHPSTRRKAILEGSSGSSLSGTFSATSWSRSSRVMVSGHAVFAGYHSGGPASVVLFLCAGFGKYTAEDLCRDRGARSYVQQSIQLSRRIVYCFPRVPATILSHEASRARQRGNHRLGVPSSTSEHPQNPKVNPSNPQWPGECAVRQSRGKARTQAHPPLATVGFAASTAAGIKKPRVAHVLADLVRVIRRSGQGGGGCGRQQEDRRERRSPSSRRRTHTGGGRPRGCGGSAAPTPDVARAARLE